MSVEVDAAEAEARPLPPAIVGMGIGASLTLVSGGAGALAANLLLLRFMRYTSTGGHCCQLVVSVDDTFYVAAPAVVLAVCATIGALAGRWVHGRWRGALGGWGALAFSAAAGAGVAVSPFAPSSPAASLVAAIGAGALAGAALLRPGPATGCSGS